MVQKTRPWDFFYERYGLSTKAARRPDQKNHRVQTAFEPTSAAAAPVITSGDLKHSDTATWTETYGEKNDRIKC
jgi:hypothetical protein